MRCPRLRQSKILNVYVFTSVSSKILKMLEERTFRIEKEEKAPDWPGYEYDRGFIGAFNSDPVTAMAQLKQKLLQEGKATLANHLDDPAFVGKYLYYCSDLTPAQLFNYLPKLAGLNRFNAIAMYHFFAAPNWTYQSIIASARKVLPRIAFSHEISLMYKIVETFALVYTDLNANFGLSRKDLVKVVLTSIFASMNASIDIPYTKQEYCNELRSVRTIPEPIKDAYFDEISREPIWLSFIFPSVFSDKSNLIREGQLKKMSRTFRKTYDRFFRFEGHTLQYFSGRGSGKLAGEIILEKTTCEFVRRNGNVVEHVLIKNKSLSGGFIWKIDKGRRKEAKNQELQLLGATTDVLKKWTATINYMAFMARVEAGMHNGLLCG